MSTGVDYGHIFEILIGAAPVAIAAYVAIKVESAVTKTRMEAVKEKVDGMDGKIDKMDGVLVTLAETKGEMAVQAQTILMTGARVDDLAKAVADNTRRLNEWIQGKSK